jgi:small-conductance mechanosensitive channel
VLSLRESRISADDTQPELGMEADNLQDALIAVIAGMRAALQTELTSIWLPIQIGAVGLAAIAAIAIAAIVRRKFDLASATTGWPAYLGTAVRALMGNFGVLLLIATLGIIRAGIEVWATEPRVYLLDIAINLATAWVVIAILASLIRTPSINRAVAITAWTIAALSIVGLLDATVAALDARGITLGGIRVTPLLVLKTSALLLVALWAAIALSNFLVRRVHDLPELTPAIRNLVGTLIRVAVMTIAVVVVLSWVGIDLSVLAVFTGAIGVGIGFGLQKTVSNFVAGVILLADKSVKPGDIVEVGDQFGWVTNMGARYTSVDTRQGREVLVPNEDFVTQRVINWSYSNNRMMLEAKFGVSYDSDPHRVIDIAVAAAASVPRVIADPAPVCYFVTFGDSSLDFDLRYWIADPSNGIINVRAPVMLALWDAFKREGIEIPFPQRDVNTRAPVRVIVERDGGSAAA